jgi:hypothetical protein
MNIVPNLKWEDYMTQEEYLVIHHLFLMITKFDNHGESMTYHSVSKQIAAVLINIAKGADGQVT